MNKSVTVTERGREGEVTYREDSRTITGYQEFGGGDVVAIVSMGSADDWRARHPWAVERRAQILRFIADEVIRQKAPSCSAEIDESRGDIVLRNSGKTALGSLARAASAGVGVAATSHADASWVFRFTELKAKLGLIVLVVALIVGAAVWFKTRVLVVETGRGAPFGSTVRTETYLATLISQLQPYTPSLHHDPSKERYTLNVFLVPLDGAAPKLVRLVRDLQAGSYSLAHVIGSDGQTMWVDANGLFGVNLKKYSLVTADDVAKVNPALDRMWLDDTRGMDIVDGRLHMLARDRSAAYAVDPVTLKVSPVAPHAVAARGSNPPLTLYMAAGGLIGPNAWLGLHSKTDLEGAYRTGRWLRAVESASDASRDMRRLMRADLEQDSSDGKHWRIRSVAPVSETEYRNASFLRLNEKSEPLRVSNPDSVLMLHTSGDGTGTLHVTRLEASSGRLLWTKDTGLDRFKLQQILPAQRSTVFVGTRPPVPDKVSEPLIVIVDHATGEVATHSLWQ